VRCHKFSTPGQWRNSMREIITTLAQVAGASMIAVGVGVILGLGSALIAGGILVIVGSILVDMGGSK